MKIGVRAHDFGKCSPYKMAEILSTAGYNAMQLAMPKAIAGIEDYHDILRAHLEEIDHAFKVYSMEISILGCYSDLSNPSDVVRNEAIRNVCASLDHAKIIGAKAVGSETSYERLTVEEKKKRIPYMLESIREITRYAEQVGVDFALEPVEFYPLDSIDVMQTVLQEVNYSPRLKMIFDPANVITPASLPYQGEVWKTWLTEFQERIVAIHIKDFIWNQEGEYIPQQLGCGVMDYTEIIKWIKKEHPEIALIREETIHACAKADLEFIQGFCI